MKTQMLFFRKAVWPVRDMLNSLERGEAKLFTEETLLYVRDAQDHIIQVIDTTETYRDIISGMLDIYLSSISYKLNEVMKLLTIISTIFIPITFITSLYGMNLKSCRSWNGNTDTPAYGVSFCLFQESCFIFFANVGGYNQDQRITRVELKKALNHINMVQGF